MCRKHTFATTPWSISSLRLALVTLTPNRSLLLCTYLVELAYEVDRIHPSHESVSRTFSK